MKTLKLLMFGLSVCAFTMVGCGSDGDPEGACAECEGEAKTSCEDTYDSCYDFFDHDTCAANNCEHQNHTADAGM